MEQVKSALQRRLASKNQDPLALVHQALAYADDPNLPISYETRMAIIEPLLRAKHFGKGGGLDKKQPTQATAIAKQGDMSTKENNAWGMNG